LACFREKTSGQQSRENRLFKFGQIMRNKVHGPTIVAAHTVFPQCLHTLVFTIIVGYGNFALYIQCRGGWVDFDLFYILNEIQVEKCCIPCKSWENCKKLLFVHTVELLLRAHFWVITTRGSKFFFITVGTYWVPKDPEFYVELKNINFP
jgi:hypothetical protein